MFHPASNATPLVYCLNLLALVYDKIRKLQNSNMCAERGLICPKLFPLAKTI